MIVRRPFYFLRHGESDWNVEKRCIGALDRPLTERGRAQARAAGLLCRDLRMSAIFSSPLQRAAHTAAAIAEVRGADVVEAPALMEVCLGVKQGADETDAADTFFEDWLAGAAIEGAESFAALQARAAKAVCDCVTHPRAAAGPPLLVAHSAVYKALRSVMGSPVTEVAHCAPYLHEPEGADGWRITLLAPEPG